MPWKLIFQEVVQKGMRIINFKFLIISRLRRSRSIFVEKVNNILNGAA